MKHLVNFSIECAYKEGTTKLNSIVYLSSIFHSYVLSECFLILQQSNHIHFYRTA